MKQEVISFWKFGDIPQYPDCPYAKINNEYGNWETLNGKILVVACTHPVSKMQSCCGVQVFSKCPLLVGGENGSNYN